MVGSKARKLDTLVDYLHSLVREHEAAADAQQQHQEQEGEPSAVGRRHHVKPLPHGHGAAAGAPGQQKQHPLRVIIFVARKSDADWLVEELGQE